MSDTNGIECWLDHARVSRTPSLTTGIRGGRDGSTNERLTIDDLGPKSGIEDGTPVALHKTYVSMCIIWKQIWAKYTLRKRSSHNLNKENETPSMSPQGNYDM